MEIVIKLHEKDYQSMKNGHIPFSVLNAIMNGTPLPEEHGKLKDADKLYNIFNELCDDYNIDNMSFISEMNMNFDLAQTIIEADKGE